MTLSSIADYEPIALDGKVVIERVIFDEMKKATIQLQTITAIQKAEENYKKTGTKHNGDEVLKNLRDKYVRKI